mmetsp:Transcript_31349/g.46237  ORF Transcript_31349/g.46237 Transcript_31349/m.46237 type:complete len:902 (-) Transcript_31349:440-3145(-)
MSLNDVQKQPPPLPVVDEATIKARAAAARAYALNSSGSNSDFQTPSPMKESITDGPNAAEKTNQTFIPYIQDEDYAIFVKTLTDDDFFKSLPDLDDDPEEFHLEALEEDDDDEDDDEDFSPEKLTASLLPDESGEDDDPFTIETELGLLMEEDLENAVATLVSQHPPTPDNLTESPPRTPLRECSRSSAATITQKQLSRLKNLMKRHYQLLVQQAVLSVRAVSKKHSNHGGESPDDLAEMLDGAVGMLQDLDENRKDAIRTSIQLKSAMRKEEHLSKDGRLTRAAFSKTLQLSDGTTTTFDVAGLSHLKYIFATLDNNMKNIVDVQDPKQACTNLLKVSEYEPTWLPGGKGFSELLSEPKEVFGDNFKPPCSSQQAQALKRDRNQFTAGEDSLVFRGVNLYGEKQWLLIADRFLPDRSINIISQRYSKLSLLLFRAHGIKIDENGNLADPPKLDSVDKADAAELTKLKRVDPPAILNVHRWSIEEDLTLLKAVPVLGHMWAELSSRLMPHRDRGHLRKRYQVLERRAKATVLRSQKETPRLSKKEVKAPPHFLKKRASVSTKSVSDVSSRVVNRSPSVLRSPQENAQHYSAPTSTAIRNRYGPYDDYHQPHYPPPAHHHLPLHPMSHPHYQYRDRYPPHPYQYYQHYNPERSEHPKDTSRSRVEKILKDSDTNDDSNMARVQEMMTNDDNERSLESEVANTISKLSKKDEKMPFIAPRADLERLQKIPTFDASNHSNGLNMLAANAREGVSPVKPPRGSILKSVLERAGRQEHNASETVRKPGTPLASPVPRIGYSPAASFSMHMSPPGSTFLFPNNSEDGFAFDISDRSRQMLGTPSKLPSLEPNSTLEDLDAASALNSLSNSPARFSNAISKDTSGVKRSLFDKVIKKTGDGKNKKRKL